MSNHASQYWNKVLPWWKKIVNINLFQMHLNIVDMRFSEISQGYFSIIIWNARYVQIQTDCSRIEAYRQILCLANAKRMNIIWCSNALNIDCRNRGFMITLQCFQYGKLYISLVETWIVWRSRETKEYANIYFSYCTWDAIMVNITLAGSK